MTSSSEGFRFSFGDDDVAAAPGGGPSSTSWPPPTTWTSSFPWIPLDSPTVALWGSPANEETADGHVTLPQQLQVGETVLHYQTAPEITALTSTATATTEGEAEARDIVPGKYYGGLKVWSCAPSLATFLLTNREEWGPKVAPTGSSSSSSSIPIVAEVGCGQALPGLAALALGAARLILQDYNAEVLDVCVKPNVAATMAALERPAPAPAPLQQQQQQQVKLLHGDWVDLGWDEEGHCDVILGADVTFDEEACDKLVNLLTRWLKPGSGVALIATKVYYFGTNGGALEFTERATKAGLTVTEAARMEEGGGMNRVILSVVRPC